MSSARLADGVGTVLAHEIAAGVVDPEMPFLSLEDLGVLRDVSVTAEGGARVAITPTYTGCPALTAMRDDLVRRLGEAGFDPVEVVVELDPAWSSDDITDRGRQALRDHGLSPPAPVGNVVALPLIRKPRELICPLCGAGPAQLVSEFGSTSCKALYRCPSCLEPFEHVKEL